MAKAAALSQLIIFMRQQHLPLSTQQQTSQKAAQGGWESVGPRPGSGLQGGVKPGMNGENGNALAPRPALLRGVPAHDDSAASHKHAFPHPHLFLSLVQSLVPDGDGTESHWYVNVLQKTFPPCHQRSAEKEQQGLKGEKKNRERKRKMGQLDGFATGHDLLF